MTSLGIDDFTAHKCLITFFPSHYILRDFMKFWLASVIRQEVEEGGIFPVMSPSTTSLFSFFILISSIKTNVIKYLINNTFPHAKKGSANSNFEMNFITRFFFWLEMTRYYGTRDISSWNWKKRVDFMFMYLPAKQKRNCNGKWNRYASKKNRDINVL